MKNGRRIGTLALLAAVPVEASAALQFDQLSACASLDAAMQELRRPTIGCVAPRSAIERAVADRLRPATDLTLCFLVRAPTTQLARFSCIIFRSPGKPAHLDCIAPAKRSDVNEYRTNYDIRYAAVVNRYIEAANRCPIGNGDAAKAQWTLMSPFLNWVAKFDLGFMLPVGRGLVGQSTILHGYAGIDPDAVGRAGEEIEFFSMYEPDRS